MNKSTSLEDCLPDEVLELFKRVKCGSCQHILKEPVQMVCCGHSLCQECAKMIFLHKSPAKCHNEGCTKQLELVDQSNYEKSSEKQAEVNDLFSVVMTCHISDCDWKGCFRDYEDHLNADHPLRVVQDVPRKISTHSLVSHDGTESTNVQVVGTVPRFVSGIGSPSHTDQKPIDFTSMSAESQMGSFNTHVTDERIATSESKNQTKESSKMVTGRISSAPPKDSRKLARQNPPVPAKRSLSYGLLDKDSENPPQPKIVAKPSSSREKSTRPLQSVQNITPRHS